MLFSALVYTGIHWRISQIMSFHVNVEICATINCCVKLGKAPTQTNDKITAVHINYKVSRRLLFKPHKLFHEGRESLEDDFRSRLLVNVK